MKVLVAALLTAVIALVLTTAWNAAEAHYANCLTAAHTGAAYPAAPVGDSPQAFRASRTYQGEADAALKRERELAHACSRLP